MTNEGPAAEQESTGLAPGDGDGTRRPRRDFFGALVFAAIAAAFVVQALRMPFRDPSWEWYTSPNVFPLAMALCLGGASLYVAVRGLLGWRANRAAIPPIRWMQGAREWGMPRFLAGVAAIAVLVALLGRVDFYVLSGASVIVFGVAFRTDPLRKAMKSAGIAAAFVVAFLYAIGKVFGIVFP